MERFRDLLAEVMLRNRFYQGKYANSAIKLEEFHVPADLARLPFVAKSELIADHTEHPPYGEILTYSVSSYSRLHQTSGTTSGKASVGSIRPLAGVICCSAGSKASH